MTGRGVRVVVAAVLLALALPPLRVAWVAYAPAGGSERVAAQVDFLTRALADGRDEDMQRLFPEGAFFLTALTASASAATGSDPAYVRGLRDRLSSPELLSTFGGGMRPEHGIFSAGWALATAVDVAESTGAAEDRTVVERAAEVVEAALGQTRSGFLEGYPGQYWPCDTVVAAASLARAATLLDRPDWRAVVRTWRATAQTHLDPTTGLLPHRVDRDGAALEGPRGSSQAIIQAFWPQLARALGEPVDTATWDRFRSAFVTRVAGLVGVREHPVGTNGVGDVDSGPLVAGVSLSASAVTLAAARQVGDGALVDDLDREAELLGLPLTLPGGRRFAGGVLPVGDAFVAWARTRPLADSSPGPVAPGTAWPALIVATALPLMAAGAVLAARRASRRGVRAR